MHQAVRLTTWRGSRGVLCGIALTALVMTGCASTSTEFFLHVGHREYYAFSDEELKEVPFYISKEVLAHLITADGTTTADDVVVLPMNTAGRVTDVGPNWLRVAFDPAGQGVYFLASGRESDSLYKLATKIEGRSGLHRIVDMDDKVLLSNGRKFKIIRGDRAFLLINEKDLKAVVARRTHLAGG